MSMFQTPTVACCLFIAASVLCVSCSVEEAVQTAKEEWKHYTHCLELVG